MLMHSLETALPCLERQSEWWDKYLERNNSGKRRSCCKCLWRTCWQCVTSDRQTKQFSHRWILILIKVSMKPGKHRTYFHLICPGLPPRDLLRFLVSKTPAGAKSNKAAATIILCVFHEPSNLSIMWPCQSVSDSIAASDILNLAEAILNFFAPARCTEDHCQFVPSSQNASISLDFRPSSLWMKNPMSIPSDVMSASWARNVSLDKESLLSERVACT